MTTDAHDADVYEHIATAEGVLKRYTTGRPGIFEVTYAFEADAREEMLPVILHDHQMLRVTVEKKCYADGVHGDVRAQERDPWAFGDDD